MAGTAQVCIAMCLRVFCMTSTTTLREDGAPKTASAKVYYTKVPRQDQALQEGVAISSRLTR